MTARNAALAAENQTMAVEKHADIELQYLRQRQVSAPKINVVNHIVHARDHVLVGVVNDGVRHPSNCTFHKQSIRVWRGSSEAEFRRRSAQRG